MFAYTIPNIKYACWNWNAIGKSNGLVMCLLSSYETKRNASMTANISGNCWKIVSPDDGRVPGALYMCSRYSEKGEMKCWKKDMFNESFLIALKRWEIIHQLAFYTRHKSETKAYKATHFDVSSWRKKIRTKKKKSENSDTWRSYFFCLVRW